MAKRKIIGHDDVSSKYFRNDENSSNNPKNSRADVTVNTVLKFEDNANIKDKEPKTASNTTMEEANVKGEATEGVTVRDDEMSKGGRLTRTDFQKPGLQLAEYLLGKIIVHVDNNETLSGRIVETEAYLGEMDKACHAYGGKTTDRTKPMYMAEGTAYVYSIYGMYFCLNISSSDVGGCILIRALEPRAGIDTMRKYRSAKRKETSRDLKNLELCSGPSKLCQAMNITKNNLNAADMTSSCDFYVLDDGCNYTDSDVVICKRIGIEGYGEESASKPYRFYVRGNKNVSVKDKSAEMAPS